MNVKKILSFFLKKILSKPINYFFNKTKIVIIFRNGFALGDQVLMTSVIKEIAYKKKKKIFLFITNDEIFINNPRILKIFKLKNKSLIWFFLRNLIGSNILEFISVYATKKNHGVLKKYFLNFHSNNRIHLAHAMSEHFDFDLEYKDLENEFFFSKDELKKFESEGAFATNTQVLSAFLTLFQITLVFFSFFLQINNIFLLILFILNLFTEFNFFKFIKKLYDINYIPFSILGVYLINFSIILGFFYGLLNLMKKN